MPMSLHSTITRQMRMNLHRMHQSLILTMLSLQPQITQALITVIRLHIPSQRFHRSIINSSLFNRARSPLALLRHTITEALLRPKMRIRNSTIQASHPYTRYNRMTNRPTPISMILNLSSNTKDHNRNNLQVRLIRRALHDPNRVHRHPQ